MLLGVLLIVAGIAGLAYGRVTYTRETHDAKLGPIELQVKEKETAQIPVWAGIGVIALGSVLVLKPR
jgi:hypothetical protein